MCAEVAQAILDLRCKPIQFLVLVHVETRKQIDEIEALVTNEAWNRDSGSFSLSTMCVTTSFGVPAGPSFHG